MRRTLCAGCRRMPSCTRDYRSGPHASSKTCCIASRQRLDAEDATLIRRVFESYAYVTELVEDKNTSIRRLRELLFGKPTEKTAAVLGRQADKPEPTPAAGVAAATASPCGEATSGEAPTGGPKESATDTPPAPRVMGVTAPMPTRAPRIDVPHPTLKAGDPCPACPGGYSLRKGGGGAGADHRATAFDGDGLRVAKVALPLVRWSSPLRRRPRRQNESTMPRPAA